MLASPELYSTLPRQYDLGVLDGLEMPHGAHFRNRVIMESTALFTVEQLDIVDGEVWNCTPWTSQATLEAAIEKAHT